MYNTYTLYTYLYNAWQILEILCNEFVVIEPFRLERILSYQTGFSQLLPFAQPRAGSMAGTAEETRLLLLRSW